VTHCPLGYSTWTVVLPPRSIPLELLHISPTIPPPTISYRQHAVQYSPEINLSVLARHTSAQFHTATPRELQVNCIGRSVANATHKEAEAISYRRCASVTSLESTIAGAVATSAFQATFAATENQARAHTSTIAWRCRDRAQSRHRRHQRRHCHRSHRATREDSKQTTSDQGTGNGSCIEQPKHRSVSILHLIDFVCIAN
jgi:hypothetical protein